MKLNSLICERCGLPRGMHMATTYHCPTGSGRFHSSNRFKLAVTRLADDPHKAVSLKRKSLAEIEREIARNVIKQLEYQLGILTFSHEVNSADLIDGLNLLRAGYDI